MLPLFLHCKDPAQPATDYILSTSPPFVLGKVIQFTEEADLNKFIASKSPFLGARVAGYNIVVVYSGSLENGQPDPLTFRLMATEYLARIKQREQRYRRYKTTI